MKLDLPRAADDARLAVATPAPWLAGLRTTPDGAGRPHRARQPPEDAEHLDSYLRSSPVQPHTAAAFADFEGWLATKIRARRSSSTAAAARHRRAPRGAARFLVVGVDRSEHRLSRRDGPHADALGAAERAARARRARRLLAAAPRARFGSRRSFVDPNPYPSRRSGLAAGISTRRCRCCSRSAGR